MKECKSIEVMNNMKMQIRQDAKEQQESRKEPIEQSPRQSQLNLE
jgi:hypothetical protein